MLDARPFPKEISPNCMLLLLTYLCIIELGGFSADRFSHIKKKKNCVWRQKE